MHYLGDTWCPSVLSPGSVYILPRDRELTTQEAASFIAAKLLLSKNIFIRSPYSLLDPLWQVTGLWESEGCHSNPLTLPILVLTFLQASCVSEFPLCPGSAMPPGCVRELLKVAPKFTTALPVVQPEQRSATSSSCLGIRNHN